MRRIVLGLALSIGLAGPAVADLQWVRSGGPLPAGRAMVAVGTEANNVNKGKTLYLCRVRVDGSYVPGKLLGTSCHVARNGQEVARTQFEMAAAAPGTHHWGRPGEASIPVVGGEEGGRSLVVCRGEHRTLATPSGPWRSHGTHSGKVVGGACVVGYGGGEVSIEPYEVFYETRLTANAPAKVTPPPLAGRAEPPGPPTAGTPDPAQVAPIGEARVALVVGNSAYAAVSALPNATRDAEAVAAALRAAGFRTVTALSDLTRAQLIEALDAFALLAETADWAVVYFAGHGIEMGGLNYLVPVDARLRSDRNVADEAVPLERVAAAIERARKMRLVVLDACRENPFAPQMRLTGQTRSVARGLARIEPEGGTLVAYAAKHGQVALDGDAKNSPFVSALVKRLATPGVEIRKLFGLVRDDVLAATGRRQEPFIYGTLGGEDFFFRPVQAN